MAAVLSLSGFFVALSGPTLTTSAGASPSQVGGNDVPAWSPGWSWTYNEVDTLSDPGTGGFVIDLQVTYTVAAVNVVHDGYNTYQENMSGTITGGSGSASGFTVSSVSGSIAGTQWQQMSNLATVETDQTISASAKVSIATEAITFVDNEVYGPSQVSEDFRLHNGDSWNESTVATDTGSVVYSGVESGNSPVNTTQTINAPATDAQTTFAGPAGIGTIAVDQISYNDTTDTSWDVQDWAPVVNNIATDDNVTGEAPGTHCSTSSATTCGELTKSLIAVHDPAPSTTATESIAPNVACGGQTVTVSGNLSTGASGASVTVALDEEVIAAGQTVTHTVSSTGGGAYSTTFVAPITSDGLGKGGVRGTFPVQVTSGGILQEATLEVLPQDCTSTVYTGATTSAQGGSATVSASVTDIATGQPVVGAPVVFSLSGQSGTASTSTGSNGVATASLNVATPPRSDTLTASYAGGAADAASSATSPFTVTTDLTTTSLTSSDAEATIGDAITFTATVAPSGPAISTNPTGTVLFTADGAPLGAAVTLPASGIATITGGQTLANGSHDIVATYSGDSNYVGSVGTFTQFVHPPLTSTKTTLTSSTNPTVFGQTTTLTATVAPTTGSGSPTMSVEFLDGTTDLGVVALSGGTPDQATLAVTSLPVGSDSLTASYLGDGFVTYAASTSAPVQQNVQPDGTTVTVTPSSNPAVTGQALTFDIQVAPKVPGGGVPTGTATVSIDGTQIGSPLALSGSVATISVPAGLSAGTHSVSVKYSGDGNFAAATGTLSEVVNPDATTTVLQDTPNPSVQNQAVSFTATVTPVAPGSGTPTGTVNFFNGATPMGSVTLSSTANGDQATLQLANLPLGDNTITATYTGNANFSTSTTATPLDQVVDVAPPVFGTSTALSSAVNPSRFGQGTSFTATVSSIPMGSTDGGTPTGTVQFSVDGTNLGAPVALDANGTAVSPAVSNLAPGGHTIIAAYGGVTSTGGSFSLSGADLSQSVQQSATSVVVASSANPATYGQALTFSATLHAVSPGVGTPGGQIQFLLNGADLGAPVTVSGGAASVGDSSILVPGTYTVSVIATGDADFAGVAGSTTFVVAPIGVTTTLVANPNPVVFGNSIILQATVTPNTGPMTPPTGLVQFFQGSTLLGQAPLGATTLGQRAGIAITAPNPGVYSLTAVYQGNAMYGVASSTPVSETVQIAPTSIAPATASMKVGVLTPSTETLSVTLTNTSNHRSIAGQPISFSTGSTFICTAVTNTNGVASCTSSAGFSSVLLSGYTAIYSGSIDYLGFAAKGAG
ncbi:MAG TPA: Ig-like domain-containing protein [Acidimicrobiales bacterium]|jgi:hypothetical protein|nr:Ig-like domain-containing protein [Acidimicrobiales bacterium]